MTAMALALFLMNSAAAVTPPVDPPLVDPGELLPLPYGIPLIQLEMAGPTVVDVTPGTFQSALNSAVPGTTRIRMLNGTYGGTYTYNKSGSLTQPVQIVGESRAGVILTGTLSIAGSGCLVRDITVNGGIDIKGGAEYNRVDRIHGTAPSRTIFIENATLYTRVSRCHFDGSGNTAGNWSVYCDVDGSTTQNGCRYVHIDQNFFDHCKAASLRLSDSSSAGRLGYLQAVVEMNYFLNCGKDGAGFERECIVGKSSMNTIRFNTLQSDRGDNMDISLRHCSFWDVHNNILLGVGGITMFGINHFIRNNLLINCKKNIWAGMGTYYWRDELTSGQHTGRPSYPACEDTAILNNTVVFGSSATDAGITINRFWRTSANDIGDTGDHRCNRIIAKNNLLWRLGGGEAPIRFEFSGGSGNVTSDNFGNVPGTGTTAPGGIAFVQDADDLYRFSGQPAAASLSVAVKDENINLNKVFTVAQDLLQQARGTSTAGAELNGNSAKPLALRDSSNAGVSATDYYAGS